MKLIGLIFAVIIAEFLVRVIGINLVWISDLTLLIFVCFLIEMNNKRQEHKIADKYRLNEIEQPKPARPASRRRAAQFKRQEAISNLKRSL